MLLLAIESATDTAGIAVADERGLLATVTVERGRRHAETLAPAIDFACRRSGIAPQELDAVAVDVGPGLFTGLRVGIATAKAFATALGLPVVEVSSLQVLAAAAEGTGLLDASLPVPPLAAVVDARRGEVFWARCSPFGAASPATGTLTTPRSPGGQLRLPAGGLLLAGDPAISAPDMLARELPSSSLLVGDGAARYRELLEAAGHRVAGPALQHPPVAALADLGVRWLRAGLACSPGAVSPRYLRQADARINWEQRLAPRAVLPT